MNETLQARFAHELARLQPASPFGRFVESAIAKASPARAQAREQDRRRLAHFRAQGAISNNGRANVFPGHTGNTHVVERERRQLMWNALDLVDNSGLAESITSKFATYVCGTLRYQARTGDKAINNLYEAIVKEKTRKCFDLSGRHSLPQKAQIAVRGIVVKGGAAADFVRMEPDDPDIYLRGVEYDRIGSPWDYSVRPDYVGGIVIDPRTGREVAFDVYSRDRMGGSYQFQERVDAYDPFGRRQFLHLFNPKNFDQYKGETAFKTSIDLIHYCDSMRKFELQSMQWAATQTAIYYTNTGELPQRAFEERVDAQGRTTRIYNVGGGGPEVSAQEVGEDTRMFESQRPSPNVLSMWLNCVKEVCIAVELPMTTVYGQDANGPGVRFDGAQAARTFARWWSMLEEGMLEPSSTAILGNAIAQGEAPYHPRWNNGRWYGPTSVSIDAGYDSKDRISELAEGLTTQNRIATDQGNDIEEIKAQRGIEVEEDIKMAQNIGKEVGLPWNVVFSMLRQMNGAAGGAQAGLAPATDPAKAGATSDGATLDDGDTKAQVADPRARINDVVTRLKKDDKGHEHDKNGEFAPKGGGDGGGSKKDEKKDAPKSGDEDDRGAKRSKRAEVGDLHDAKREGGKIVMADGSDLPAHIKPGMIAPAYSHNLKVSKDPNADVWAIGQTADGQSKRVYNPKFASDNQGIKWGRVNEGVEAAPAIRQQIQRDRIGPQKENADAAWLMSEQATRPGSESDTKGNKALWSEPVSAKNFVVTDQPKGPPKVTIEVGGSKVPIRDEGARQEIAARVKSGKGLENAGYWLKSHGATTLEGRHVVPSEGGGARLQFMGKEGVWHNHQVKNPDLAAMLLQRKAASGDNGKLFDTDYDGVSKYVGGLGAGQFSPKDLRTIRANELARDMISAGPKSFDDDGARKKYVMDVAKHVSGVLGNRPQQALESYINPASFDAVQTKST